MLVRDVMSRKPLTVSHNDTLEKTVRVFSRRGITGCPVVDGRGRVVGIITQTDILRAIDAQGSILKPGDDLFSVVLGFLKKEENPFRKMLRSSVKKHMRREVITITEQDDITNAVAIMNQRDIQRLPVVRGKKLTGIISRKDIIRFLEA